MPQEPPTPLPPPPSGGGERRPMTRRKRDCSKASDRIIISRKSQLNSHGDDNGTQTKRSENVKSGRNHESNTEHRPGDEGNIIGHHPRSLCNTSPIPRRMAKPDKGRAGKPEIKKGRPTGAPSSYMTTIAKPATRHPRPAWTRQAIPGRLCPRPGHAASEAPALPE